MKKHYQKYCMHLAYAIISTSTFLFSTKTFSQEKFTINPEITKSIVEKYRTDYPDVFPVLYKEIEYKMRDTSKIILKRKTFMINGMSIDSDSLKGEFVKLKGNYRVALVDIDKQFIIDEIFSDTTDVTYNTKKMTKSYPLIQKVSTGQYYYIMTENFISSLIKDQSVNELLEIVHKLGYKEYESKERFDHDLYIKSKACEIKLDNWTYESLKKNPAYIESLDNNQMKIDALIKQTIPHSKTLDKYLGLYRIQRSKMSNANISAWKNATAQAQKLNDQIYKLDEKHAGNNSFMPLNRTNTRKEFTDNLRASKGVLGM